MKCREVDRKNLLAFAPFHIVDEMSIPSFRAFHMYSTHGICTTTTRSGNHMITINMKRVPVAVTLSQRVSLSLLSTPLTEGLQYNRESRKRTPF